MSDSFHVIVNPAAGGGRAARARASIEAALRRRGAPFRIDETRGGGDARRLSRRATETGATRIIAVGGDGTAHEVANGILDVTSAAAGEGPALGIVPAGSGNDFARLLGVGRGDPLKVLDPGEPRRFDVGRVEWDGGSEFFINGSGTGIDVEVVRQIERLPRMPGFIGYMIGVLRALARYRPAPLRVVLDGREIRQSVMIAAIMNGPRQAGGFHVCPGASPDDGRLDLCLIEAMGLVRSLQVLPRVLRGTHADAPEVRLEQASRIQIEVENDGPLYLQLDGELRYLENARGCTIETRPGALLVLPAGSGVAPTASETSVAAAAPG